MITFDIETEPGPIADIEAAMSEEMRNPVMPDEIKNPPKPDFAEKLPDYGATKAKAAYEAAKDEKTKEKQGQAVTAAAEKQAAYLAEKEKAWIAKTTKAQTDWQMKANEARLKFIRDAALDARTGFCRVVVLKDSLSGEIIVFLFETDAEKIKQVLADNAFRGDISVKIFATEVGMIKGFLGELKRKMEAEKALDDSAACVGYYIKQFDFPFLYRRAWINQCAVRPLFMRGRNWTDEVIDIHEVFAFYDRSYSVGGLDRLAEMLGCRGSKLSDGFSFRELYDRSPVDGILYCIQDVELTEECATKMSVGQ